eukprot:SAG31_NODE_20271_length_579_cov_0.783333_1_plen_61_part_00
MLIFTIVDSIFFHINNHTKLAIHDANEDVAACEPNRPVTVVGAGGLIISIFDAVVYVSTL